MTRLPHLVLTIGDINGVGPEVIVQALHAAECKSLARYTIVGSRAALESAATVCGVPPLSDDVSVIEPVEPPRRESGKVSEGAGAFAAACIEHGARMVIAGEADAIVTAPICKEAISLAGVPYPGHTEMLAELGGATTYRMMLAADAFRAVHVTLHISMRDALDAITVDSVTDTIVLAHKGMLQLGIERPRIAVAALNTHAGEACLFGSEERDVIVPAIEEAARSGVIAAGPFPPDTVFSRAYKGEFDVVVAMYHDQGHIPIKLVAFDRAVNVTLGLPFIRTSVGHGTAFDIAGTGQANPSSLISAIATAVTMSQHTIK